MAWLREFARRVMMQLKRTKFARELDEEMRAHREMKGREVREAGVSGEEALYAASRAFGNATALQERSSETWGWRWLQDLGQDMRFGARMLRKNAGFTAVGVLTLALGIGANTAIFSIVNAVILRPLPYKDSARMVLFHTKTAMFPTFTLNLSWPAFEEIRDHSGSLEEAAAYSEMDRTLTGTGQAAVLTAAEVSRGFFEEMGAAAEQGRLLSDADLASGANPVAVISDAMWRTRFAADPGIVGRLLILDQQAYTVVGVTGRGFAFPERVEVWLAAAPAAEVKANPTFFMLSVVGKLRKGAKIETLQAELGTMASRLAKDLKAKKPELAGDYTLNAQSLLENRVGYAREGYWVLLAAATLVLLIACTNLTSLLLARGWGRQREMALRGALGASPGRLRRQGLVESCLLGLLGGAAGISVAVGGVQVFRAIAPGETPRLNEISADWTVLWFALGISLLCGVLFGLAPARNASRITPGEVLKEGTGGSVARTSRFGSALVILEVALAFVLLIGSTLMMQTLAHLLRQNPGFRTDRLLTLDLPQPPDREQKDSDKRAAGQIACVQEILAEVRATPGVEDAVAADHGILNGMRFSHAGLKLEGALPEKEAGNQGVVSRYLSPGYFRMLGVALLRGREFNERDTLGAPKVILVNEAMARKFWGTLEVTGRRMSFSKDAQGQQVWREIVGVVANARDLDIQSEADPEYFPALLQSETNSYHLMLRTRGNPEALADTISQRIWTKNPEQPVTNVTTVARTVAESVGDQRMHTTLLGIFASVGLVLALLGVYGVVSYSVERQTREIGVRMALGAERPDVLGMVMRRGLLLLASGAAIGALGAVGAVRVIASELYGVKPSDPWTFEIG